MKNLLIVLTITVISAMPVILFGQAGESQSTVHSISIELPVIQTELKAGPGHDKASTLCNICHSVDYITMQPAFPRATWTAEVNKMIKVMGAPINEEDAKTIINYLSTEYGNGS
jgi:hypothetical protein